MPIDVKTPKSPGWWMQTLAKALRDRRFSPKWSRFQANPEGVRPPLNLLADYLRGEPPLTGDKQWEQSTREFLRLARMNYAVLVDEGVQNRVIPIGWRTGVDSDRDGDQVAQEVADANEFTIRFGDNLGNMLSMGTGYMSLGAPAPGERVPTITAEDPRDAITAHDPATGRTLASLKVLRDEWDGADYAYLCLPGEPGTVYTAFRKARSSSLHRAGYGISEWDWDPSAGGDKGLPLPGALNGRVPMVRFQNRGGVGEYEPHLSVLDRINDGIFERVSIAKMQAHMQRALKGLPTHYPEDFEDVELAGTLIEYPSDMFSADPGAVWRLPEGVDIWESKPGDLSALRLAIKDDVEMLATVTSTPLYMINPDAASGSAEGASTQREAHAFRVEDRQRRCNSPLADIMSMSFAWMGEPPERSDRTKIKTIWASTVRLSLEQKMSAASQAKAGGLPQDSIYVDVMGYAPSDLPRLDKERASDLLYSVTVTSNG